jgi:glycosyltransferase involved in cell wall biosynthesis
MTRVGYIVKRYPRYSETFIVNEILAHEAAGLELSIFALRIPTDTHFQPAIAEVRAPVHYLRRGGVTAAALWEEVQRTAAFNRRVWRELDQAQGCEGDELYQALLLAQQVRLQGLTHMHAHFGTTAATVARLASRFTGIPYTFTAHAKDIFHEYVDRDALAQKIADASSVVTVSDFNVDYLSRQFPRSASHIGRVYNGIDLRLFPFAPPIDRPPVILAVGRLVEKKGFSDLIDACALLREQQVEFECRIVGAGELVTPLKNQIHCLGVADRVTLTGPLPQGQVRQAMQSASLLVAPCITASTSDQDGLPTVILEAMALGTPVVATNVTGIPEAVIHEHTGLVVPQRQPACIAQATRRLLDDGRERLRFAIAARQRAEDLFDVHQNAAALRRVFANCAVSHAMPVLQGVG